MPDKILIHADTARPDWVTAAGRGMLKALRQQPWVQATPAGATWPAEFDNEVRAALTAAGYQLINTTAPAAAHGATPGPSRTTPTWTHRNYVSDEDGITVLPADTPGGHWQDESDTCPRCNPDRPRRTEQTTGHTPGAETS